MSILKDDIQQFLLVTPADCSVKHSGASAGRRDDYLGFILSSNRVVTDTSL